MTALSRTGNRKERRAAKSVNVNFIKKLPEKLTPVPREEWPVGLAERTSAAAVLRSRFFLVQVYREDNAVYPGMIRLSICRSNMVSSGRWQDGITWDELQGIKAELGFGDLYGIEVYPRERDTVNVANMRHLWLLPDPLAIGWF